MKSLLTGWLNSLLARQLQRKWRRAEAARPTGVVGRARCPTAPLNKILVIELGGLGDAVCALPAIATLGQPVTVVCRDYVAELFEIAGHKAIGITKSRDGIARVTGEWDLVISTCWSVWTTMLALRLDAKAMTGFWRPWRIETFGMPGTPPAVSREDHLATLRWKVVTGQAPAGVPIPVLTTDQRDARTAGKVVVVPFCDDVRKSLTEDELRKLRLDAPVVLGGVAEAGRVSVVTRSVRELMAALAGAQRVVSVDTGAMHVAAALGVPTTGIFKATNPHLCAPVGPHVTVEFTRSARRRR